MSSPALEHIADIGRNKQPLVVEALLKLARKLGPGAKLPTAREMARDLGVTGVTLGRSLEQLEGRGLLRCRQGSGIFVQPGILQKRVGLVFGENIFSPAFAPFGTLILRHCSKQASDHNEQFSFFLDIPAFKGVMTGAEVPAHQDLANSLKEGMLDGIILIARSSVEQETWLRQQGVPVVRAGARQGSITAKFDAVTFDYNKLIRCGIEKLARSGCQSVGLIGSLREHGAMFRAVASEFGLRADEKWIFHPANDDSYPAELHEEMGRDSAEKLLARSGWVFGDATSGDLPEGLLITDDITASGVLAWLTNCGVTPGKRIKIASHANKGSSVLARWEPLITCVRFDPEELVMQLFETLEGLMSGKPSTAPILVAPISE